MGVSCRWGWFLVASLLLVSVVGCPKKVELPGYFLNPGSHPEYPSSRYIVGVGRSSESPSAAEQAGRAEVSRQVASEIRVQVRREVEIIQDGDRSRVHKLTEHAISEKASFDHGELIRTDPASTHHDGEDFWAFVYLDRKEADSALNAEQTGVEGRLDDLRSRAVAAAGDGAPGTFVRPARKFWRQYDQWDAIRFQRRAIAGGEGGDTRKVDGWADEVLHAGGDLQDRIVWVIRVQPGAGAVPGETITAVQRALRESFSAMGLKTVIADGAPCAEDTGARDLAYGLDATVEVEQGLGHIGYKAVIDLTVEGAECFGSGNDLFRKAMDRRLLVGVHTSSKQRALELANDKLTLECGELDRVQVESCSDESASKLVIRAQIAEPVGDACPLP